MKKYRMLLVICLCFVLPFPTASAHVAKNPSGAISSNFLSTGFMDDEGDMVTLQSLVGVPMVINFWKNGCTACEQEMPLFQQMYEMYGDVFQFLMPCTSSDMPSDLDDIRGYFADNAYTMPLYYDIASALFAEIEGFNYPTTLFLNAEGVVRYRVTGIMELDVFLQGIDSIRPQPEGYSRITSEEAREMMLDLDDFVLLDVRTAGEFDAGHIEGAVLIPDTEMEERATLELLDLDAPIFIYCRSGRRSELAAQVLVSLGYTAVYDFGGLNHWTYELVQ